MPRPSVSEAVPEGHLATLEALRDRLAEDIDGCTDDKALPALVLRLTKVLNEIREIGGTGEEDADDLAARRRAKLQAASSQ